MSKAERQHYARVAALGCCVCKRLGYDTEGQQVEIHHLREGTGIGRKANFMEVVGYCPAHHRTGGWGIAYHAGPAEFEKRYGTQRSMLIEVLQELGLDYEPEE